MDREQARNFRILLAAALTLIIVGGTIDLILDQPSTWLSFHVIFEVGMVVSGLVMATALWMGWRNAEAQAGELRASLAMRNAERDAWRSRAQVVLEGLGAAVQEQLIEWDLTRAEREVALLLLKGYSHKAIARTTGRNDQTARQHASSVYQKSGLAGRAELAAYFLEGLELPDEDVDPT
jgi:DNA-binding CsgD family transcriptional regulator